MLASLQALDISALESIRTIFSVDATWFRWIIIFLGDLEPLLFSVFLIGFWLYGVSLKNNGPKHVALDLFWHVLGAFIFYWIINHILPLRPRPETVSSLPPLIDHLPDNSFPSGHAMFWGASWWALHILLGRPRVTMTFFLL
jgi:membrane-associated phospholipid phosphatase